MKLQNEANNVRKSFEANLSEQSDRARRAESAKGAHYFFFTQRILITGVDDILTQLKQMQGKCNDLQV